MFQGWSWTHFIVASDLNFWSSGHYLTDARMTGLYDVVLGVEPKVSCRLSKPSPCPTETHLSLSLSYHLSGLEPTVNCARYSPLPMTHQCAFLKPTAEVAWNSHRCHSLAQIGANALIPWSLSLSGSLASPFVSVTAVLCKFCILFKPRTFSAPHLKQMNFSSHFLHNAEGIRWEPPQLLAADPILFHPGPRSLLPLFLYLDISWSHHVFVIPSLSAETLTQFLLFSDPPHCCSPSISDYSQLCRNLCTLLRSQNNLFLEDNSLFKTPFLFSSLSVFII